MTIQSLLTRRQVGVLLSKHVILNNSGALEAHATSQYGLGTLSGLSAARSYPPFSPPSHSSHSTHLASRHPLTLTAPMLAVTSLSPHNLPAPVSLRFPPPRASFSFSLSSHLLSLTLLTIFFLIKVFYGQDRAAHCALIHTFISAVYIGFVGYLFVHLFIIYTAISVRSYIGSYTCVCTAIGMAIHLCIAMYHFG